MSTLITPRNDEVRLAFIKRASVTAGQDSEAGNRYIAEETHNRLIEFAPVYEGKLNAINATLSNRVKETRESMEAFGQLEICIRDMWDVLKRRVNRMDQPAEVLTYYELPLSGLVPKPTNRETWFVIAEKMIDGDAKAVAAGYPAMENPTAQELKEALDRARAERDDIAGADRQYDQAQEGLEELRSQADELISDVMADLRYFLRKMDEASQRRIMRTYGATFRYLQGEPEDEVSEAEPEQE